MNFDNFLKHMKPIEIYISDFDNANKGIQLICPSSYPVIELGSNLLDSYINLLQNMFNDKNSWISHFVYECDLGRKPKKIKIDEESILLDSYEKLYDLLKM